MQQSKEHPVMVYFAAPLFTQAERRWNREVARGIERLLGCTIVLPQDFPEDEGADPDDRHEAIFRRCAHGVRGCDAVVAILDGPDADSGTAFEMGCAYALGKPIVGVRTDFRRQQDRGTNIMTSRACHAFVHVLAFNEDVGHLAAQIARKLSTVLDAAARDGNGDSPLGACGDPRQGDPSA